MYETLLMIVGIILVVLIWTLKTVPIWLKILLTLVAIVLILNFFGMMRSANEPLNRLLTGDPIMSCASDRDCQMISTHCSPCDCGEVVNKDYSKICIFVDQRKVTCDPCPSLNVDYVIKCKEYKCETLWTNQST